MDSLPRLLYKYLTPERVDVLEDQRIRFTPLGAFNDPFEGRPSVTALAPESEVRSMLRNVRPSEIERAYGWLPPHVRDNVSLDTLQDMAAELAAAKEAEMLQFVSGVAQDVAQLLKKKIDESFGVLSLSEVPDSLLMWSHYASSHSGLVVAFDPRHQYFDQRKSENDELRHLRRVPYRDSRPCGAMTTMEGVDLFLVKSIHWSYEREWRMLRPLDEGAQAIAAAPFDVHLFDFPAAAVKEVVLGARMAETTRNRVVSLVRSGRLGTGIRILEAVPDATDFKLRIDELPVENA